MKITILGSGTSTGVPEVGCQCAVCRSSDPHDKRLRTSALVEVDDTRILLDCGPDFRAQVMNLPFKKIDGVLITHEHYDHVEALMTCVRFAVWERCSCMPRNTRVSV